MMTLSIDVSAMPHGGKSPHCYHLVTLKSACLLQLFAAGADRAAFLKSPWLWMIEFNVLDLFLRAAMFIS
jgi:hypothetical protein